MRAYRNLALAKKLFLSLMIIAGLTILVGFLGISATSRLSEEAEKTYTYNTLPMMDLAIMYDTLASQRICANNMVIFRETNPEFAAEESDALAEKEALFDDAFLAYSKVLSNKTEEQLYNNMYRLYYNDFKEIKASVRSAVASGDVQAMSDAIYALDSMGAEISGYMDEAFALNDGLASENVQANQELHRSRTLILIAAMAVGALCAFFFAVFLTRIIGRPIKTMSEFFVRFGTTGDLSMTEDDQRNIAVSGGNKDEIGLCISGAVMMVNRIVDINEKLGKVADGDLAIDLEALSEKDSMGIAIVGMIESLNSMFAKIHTSTEQISTGSRQVADGAQALALGSTEQASAIEQLSASIGDIADKTVQNANVAKKAAELSGTIRGSAEKGSEQMDRMMQAVGEINEASTQISKVIKVIDDIAFQTNILALNAAVEAARAGQHGKGFAVVAEEVRNLAAKSADAAKDTGGLIENSIQKANLGLDIATETSASLKEIVESINHSTEIVMQIARSSDEQASAIAQINTGIDQVAQVVSQNSATAEQSAAASEEMSGQSNILEQMLAHFKLKESNRPYSVDAPSHRRALVMPEYGAPHFTDDDSGFGKY